MWRGKRKRRKYVVVKRWAVGRGSFVLQYGTRWAEAGLEVGRGSGGAGRVGEVLVCIDGWA